MQNRPIIPSTHGSREGLAKTAETVKVKEPSRNVCHKVERLVSKEIMGVVSERAGIDAVMRAAGRSAATVHAEMKRGVSSLATITSVASLLGLLVTLEGIVGSFVGCGRGALGLLVGILSLLCYRYLRGRLEDLDIQMKNMTLELANAVAALVRSKNGNSIA